ncbi:MAG: hypothetical protein Kow0029_16920 [Candidatus Rifleibacteriota bacterium]
MNSPRRLARETALKALYQAEMVGTDLEEALNQVISETLLYPALESVARKFIKNSGCAEVLSGEVEDFIPDFSETISVKALNEKEDIDLHIKHIIEKYFSGITDNTDAGTAVKNLQSKTRSVLNKNKPVEEFSRQLIKAADKNRKKIDSIIESLAQNWTLERMSSIDRCILRFAACELLFFPEIPVNASINEAIELAKKFSAERSYEFVNGILDRIRKEHKLVKNVPVANDKAKKNKKADSSQSAPA